MWPMVEKYISQVDNNQLLIDLGCGNGKNMLPRIDNSIGLEISSGLGEICKERKLEVSLGDCTGTPFRSAIATVFTMNFTYSSLLLFLRLKSVFWSKS